MSIIITNPIRYTVPSDSEDSDIEEDSQPKFLQQNPNYVKQPVVQFLGEPGDVLQSLKYKLMNESKKRAHQDRSSSKHLQEHKDKIEAIKQKILDLQKQHTEESLAKIHSSLSQLEIK
ncbi:hypothetical protein BDC45DRAFT_322542 [Circinella umbellata]|nr:hypothetical protein BDC45DRAFT_322542 [Circinella umbellata]